MTVSWLLPLYHSQFFRIGYFVHFIVIRMSSERRQQQNWWNIEKNHWPQSTQVILTAAFPEIRMNKIKGMKQMERQQQTNSLWLTYENWEPSVIIKTFINVNWLKPFQLDDAWGWSGLGILFFCFSLSKKLPKIRDIRFKMYIKEHLNIIMIFY